MDILDLLLFNSGGGGSPPEPTNPWIAGDQTTLTQVGDKLRITAVNPGILNPRAYKAFTVTDLTPATVYHALSSAEAEGGHNAGTGFFRISNNVAIPDGSLGQQQINGAETPIDVQFTMQSNTIYIGYVVLCNVAGDYADIDYDLVING